MSGPTRAASPWSRADIRTAGLLALPAAALPAWAWRAASGTADIGDQTGPLAVAIVGAIVSVTGAGMWVVVGRHAVSTWRSELLERIHTEVVARGDSSLPQPSEPAVFVAVPGSSRYHRHDCPLVLGKRVERIETLTAAAERHRPCEMCRP